MLALLKLPNGRLYQTGSALCHAVFDGDTFDWFTNSFPNAKTVYFDNTLARLADEYFQLSNRADGRGTVSQYVYTVHICYTKRNTDIVIVYI